MTVNELLETKLDGVVRAHKGSVKIDVTGTSKADPAYTINNQIDYTGVTVRELIDNYAAPNAWISRQRVLRGLSKDEIDKMVATTQKIHILDMGKKPKTYIDVKASFMATFENASAEEQAKMLDELMARAKATEAPATGNVTEA